MCGTMIRPRGFRAALGAGAMLVLLAAPVQAGPVFIPGEMTGAKFVPASSPSSYSVRYSNATVTAEDAKATVQLDDLIDALDKESKAVCLIPLPAGTLGSDIRVTVGAPGEKPTILADAKFLPSEKAQEIYEAVARGSGSGM